MLLGVNAHGTLDLYSCLTLTCKNGLDSNYIEEVYRFVKWCEENYLILNVSKTKEMIIDFRRQKSTPTPLVINNETVEIVHTYKYLGFTVDDKLNWHEHCNELIKKINKRMYFLRKLKSFTSKAKQ